MGSCDPADFTIDDDGYAGRIQGATASNLDVLGEGEDEFVKCGGS